MERNRDIALALYELAAGTVRRTPTEMSRTAISTLATLERKGPHRITDLAAAQQVTQPSMTVLVGRLETAGYVVRSSDPADKRVSLVALTDEGAAYLAGRRTRGTDSLAALVGKLSAEDIGALAAAVPAMRRLRDLEADEPA